MATFAELKTETSELLLDPSNTAISAATVAASINASIAYWKFRRFWFNEGTYDSTMIVDDPVIYLPSDFLVEMPMNAGFVINYSGARYPLVKYNPKEFDDIYSDDNSGLPQIYTLKDGVYNAHPIPDSAYVCKVWYLKDYVTLSADGDTNDFTNNASDLIKYWALSKLYAERRQDEKMSEYYSARAIDEYDNLQIRNSKSNKTGHLTIHSIL